MAASRAKSCTRFHLRAAGLTNYRGRGRSHNTIATVSYTHLRAHETVLDLVCRLLLEKKKE